MTTLTVLFEPDPDQPYGRCQDCAATFQDRAQLQEHLDATYRARSEKHSHKIWISNPSRLERIERRVHRLIETAMRAHIRELDIDTHEFEIFEDDFETEVFDQLDAIVDDGHATEYEIKAALSSQNTLQETWCQRQGLEMTDPNQLTLLHAI
ncbi:hypothetical protein M3D63_09580 [Kocuria palustris]|uniref:hypothetical protein n=1 Tax=Kocuria palustris TaxID=71999 RepID=UPI0021A883E5|nr:hypothetical protein [Kocuria palustris]MCT1835020.1 hypothetical protein [Kocuria palustris]MDH5151979.1 hypothetical protein [Kocuria palustris]